MMIRDCGTCVRNSINSSFSFEIIINRHSLLHLSTRFIQRARSYLAARCRCRASRRLGTFNERSRTRLRPLASGPPVRRRTLDGPIAHRSAHGLERRLERLDKRLTLATRKRLIQPITRSESPPQSFWTQAWCGRGLGQHYTALSIGSGERTRRIFGPSRGSPRRLNDGVSSRPAFAPERPSAWPEEKRGKT